MQVLKPNKHIIHFIEAEAGKAFQLANQKQRPVWFDFWAPGCTQKEKSGPIKALKSKFWGQRADVLNMTL